MVHFRVARIESGGLWLTIHFVSNVNVTFEHIWVNLISQEQSTVQF